MTTKSISSPTVRELTDEFSAMPILTDEEINLLPFRRRREIRRRERMLETVKRDCRAGVTAHDMMMRASNRLGAKARAKAEETARIVAEITSMEIPVDPDGPAHLAALEADLVEQHAHLRRTA